MEDGERSSNPGLTKTNLIKCKSTIQIATFSVRTLNRIDQLPVRTAFAIDHNIDIICVQKHRYLHRGIYKISRYQHGMDVCLGICMEKVSQLHNRGCR